MKSYILSAAMSILNMTTLDDVPCNDDLISADNWLQSDDVRQDTLSGIALKIVSRFVNINTDFDSKPTEHDNDKVLQYSILLMSIGLLYWEFSDAIKEGDGMRVIRCWRYMMLYFRTTGRTNYAIEAFTMLAQYHFVFSEREKQQLIWSRFVNTSGLPGRNIPCDLYMEHLNRVCKDAVNGLAANKTPKALVRVGKVVGVLDSVVKSIENDLNSDKRSGKHNTPSINKDIIACVSVLAEAKVFQYSSDGRCHTSFPNIIANPLSYINHETLSSWMYSQLNNIIYGF